MELILTAEEMELVSEILQERHRELRREIARTDHREFKLGLQRKQRLIESILEKMRTMKPVAEAVMGIRG